MADKLSEQRRLSRRAVLAGSAGAVSLIAATKSVAQDIASLPPREPGGPMSALSARSSFVKLARIPEAGPGQRPVDPADAINSKTPLQDLSGVITPTDLHYERSHSGVPDLDPATHRLLIHGMVASPRVLTVALLRSMPSVTRTLFIECTGNGWENWKSADPKLTVQNTHGLVSTNEWTGVPLRHLIDMVGKDEKATWMLAEGADAAGVARSIPLIDEILDEAFIAFAQNGEPLRPAHGFPIRLITPGLEGNLHIKWLRRLKFGDKPWMTQWETARYTQLQADGTARQMQLRMEPNSVITSPSGTMKITAGPNLIQGLAWSGHGAVARVEVSADGGKKWTDATISQPALPKAQIRFETPWVWDGRPALLVSRVTDAEGNVQPDRAKLIGQTGTNALFHYNAQQTWSVDSGGRVSNVLS